MISVERLLQGTRRAATRTACCAVSPQHRLAGARLASDNAVVLGHVCVGAAWAPLKQRLKQRRIPFAHNQETVVGSGPRCIGWHLQVTVAARCHAAIENCTCCCTDSSRRKDLGKRRRGDPCTFNARYKL